MQLVNFSEQNHNKTKRNYLERMTNNKIECMETSQLFEYDYWDGDRKFGYGGYVYDGRFKSIAQKLIQKYNLNQNSTVVDFGCGKGFLLYEILKQIDCKIIGIDVSKYAINSAPQEIKKSMLHGSFELLKKIEDRSIDLFISTMTLHNFDIIDLEKCILEINRISKNSYISIESYRNNLELFNLQCWALTCKSFFSSKEWEYILNKNNYRGDYELLYFT